MKRNIYDIANTEIINIFKDIKEILRKSLVDIFQWQKQDKKYFFTMENKNNYIINKIYIGLI